MEAQGSIRVEINGIDDERQIRVVLHVPWMEVFFQCNLYIRKNPRNVIYHFDFQTTGILLIHLTIGATMKP